MIHDYFTYTSSNPAELFQDVIPYDAGTNHSYVSSMALFTLPTKAKYSFSRFGIVAATPDKELNERIKKDGKEFFENYVFNISTNKVLNFTDWEVEVFDDRDTLFNNISTTPKEPFCCGITFKEFDLENDKYDIEFHLSKVDVPDTNLLDYNPLIRLPAL
jgi:hypothetical protein